MNNIFDFEINIKENRNIKILQLTDFQPVDFSQQRYEDRLHGIKAAPFGEKMRQKIVYQYVDKLVNENKPDLILITGDYVYGEFDDSGENLISLSNHMNSFNIPWAPIFGNHDNESKKGVAWQCEQLENYSHCFFKRGNVTGNGNYTIGVFQNNKLVKAIFMVDSNGCANGKTYSYLKDYPSYNLDEKIETRAGIFEDQINWIDIKSKEIDKEYGTNKKIICAHVPPSILVQISFEDGYQSNAEYTNDEHYTLGVDKVAKNGDFGTKGEIFATFPSQKLWPVLKKNNFTHFFTGHDHNNNISILCDGIRVTFGVKTGTGDYYNQIGGTLITLDNDNVNIEHIFIE